LAEAGGVTPVTVDGFMPRFSYTADMSSSHQASRLNIPAFASEGEPLAGTTLLQNMERLAKESSGLQPDLTIKWLARAELRPGAGAEDDIWLHLTASSSIALTCQRCMTAVDSPIEVDQWYRFVATEEIAMAEDDEAEEDLLVLEPQFDLLAVLEDELIMELPVVPMHEVCPVPLQMRDGDADTAVVEEKPNPFAVLSQLKKSSKAPKK
jgi:uncharacterized protein